MEMLGFRRLAISCKCGSGGQGYQIDGSIKALIEDMLGFRRLGRS